MDATKVAEYRRKIKKWGQENYRDFPWRRTRDPYEVLLAEIMLHRTQAPQVKEVYQEFVRCYPNVETLARAACEELETNLYSLGLRWRTHLIQKLASDILGRFDGRVPQSKDDMTSLPGVSDYICSAVRCFAWNLPETLIDTNTVRVIGRLYNLTVRDSSRRDPQFRRLIADLVDPTEPRVYNYALLDLADTICTKRQPPDHDHCPLIEFCLAGPFRQDSCSPMKRAKAD